jgi:hypothetical protein
MRQIVRQSGRAAKTGHVENNAVVTPDEHFIFTAVDLRKCDFHEFYDSRA